ncbi:hypothetical protein PHYBLDRAFT_60752 [Phycomyces blakesleeanus NRRL 1555(-)]|uniref:Uncharacterized protein n=1 Tax=Phycomyces blakesleeanus (strain ATCC 8743b / DSM 1359 / FGSC 10004 / NBRC 33097 / NRRL 1555) TaxID=763407 RepID=A0A167PBX0_PHYB8|nr:hypothetical protein PHYBLDRAFT_60752 [Phycomyces blakesleeanus NRRL 1555(-)]OAD77624.1 hypothetical protein PHYBLDRAFT_60752 [Phycomyces blakesleeanus NRRL 1555(-)]|eukprot:XP_018295664.1 hypothetical protein PHYBLDRAFT_60752 [Phycomyces blakesleeanus NRRL 1555(-)]
MPDLEKLPSIVSMNHNYLHLFFYLIGSRYKVAIYCVWDYTLYETAVVTSDLLLKALYLRAGHKHDMFLRRFLIIFKNYAQFILDSMMFADTMFYEERTNLIAFTSETLKFNLINLCFHETDVISSDFVVETLDEIKKISTRYVFERSYSCQSYDIFELYIL